MWQSIGSSLEPEKFLPRYQNVATSKPQDDEVAKQYFEERYGCRLEERLTKWRMGKPNRLSALKNFLRYRTPLGVPKPDSWQMAIDWTKRVFNFMSDSRVDFSAEYIKSFMNMQSSPGFPWSRGYERVPACPTKDKLWKLDDGKTFTYVCESYVEELKNPKYIPGEWYTLSAKKELRKVTKISSNDYRAYTAASVRNTWAGTAMLADMCTKFYQSWSFSPAFVGGSIFHASWNQMMQRLAKHPHAFECDETAWDATMSPDMLFAVRDILWEYVSPEFKSAELKIQWTNWFMEMCDSLILCSNGDLLTDRKSVV